MADLLLEEVGRALVLSVKNNINDVIDSVWDDMAAQDTAFYAEMGQAVETTPKVYPVSFYLGHHPDILEHDVADYPNIVAMCYTHNPVAEVHGADQIEVMNNTAFVEAFVVHADASTVNRLAWRYAKSLHRLITSHKDLDSWPSIWTMDRSPTVTVSQSFAKRVDEFSDEWVFLQGCRLEYAWRTPVAW